MTYRNGSTTIPDFSVEYVRRGPIRVAPPDETFAQADLVSLAKAHRIVAEHDAETMPADHGGIECTLGTVPKHRDTGLCDYHAARELLAKARRSSPDHAAHEAGFYSAAGG